MCPQPERIGLAAAALMQLRQQGEKFVPSQHVSPSVGWALNTAGLSGTRSTDRSDRQKTSDTHDCQCHSAWARACHIPLTKLEAR
jgi:hypothetical protein